jgi:hypothetical protein
MKLRAPSPRQGFVQSINFLGLQALEVTTAVLVQQEAEGARELLSGPPPEIHIALYAYSEQ